MKREDVLKPYDSKKSYWAPDGKGGFIEGLVESNDGKKAVMMFGHIVSINYCNYWTFSAIKIQ